MKLYHGSVDLVDEPRILNGANYLDFGPGFYTTSSFEQAERWARIKMRRSNVSTGYVCVYDFDLKQAESDCVLVRFDYPDEVWLRFVTDHRRGIAPKDECDLHIGPVADDNVYRTIRLFETGVYDVEETVKRLKTEVLHDQWVLHTPNALSHLIFLEAKPVHQED